MLSLVIKKKNLLSNWWILNNTKAGLQPAFSLNVE